MSASSHVVSHSTFVIVYFVIVFSNIQGRKMRFSEISQEPVSEKLISRQFEAVSLNV